MTVDSGNAEELATIAGKIGAEVLRIASVCVAACKSGRKLTGHHQ